MFWKREILHDWMETPDSIAICFYAVSGSPLSWRALTRDVHLLLSPASHEACCCQKALIIDHRHRLFWRSVLRPQFFFYRDARCALLFCFSGIRHQCRSVNDTAVTHRGPVVLITWASRLHSPAAWFESHFCVSSANLSRSIFGVSDCCRCEVDDEH